MKNHDQFLPLKLLAGTALALILTFTALNFSRLHVAKPSDSAVRRGILEWCSENPEYSWVKSVRILSVSETDTAGVYLDPSYRGLVALRDTLVSVREALKAPYAARKAMLEKSAADCAKTSETDRNGLLQAKIDWLSRLQGRNPAPEEVSALYAEIQSLSERIENMKHERGCVVDTELSGKGREETVRFARPGDIDVFVMIGN